MPDRIIGLYERHAGAWDRERATGFVERGWIERFAAPLARGSAILDLGCGGGEPIARHLIDTGFALTGVDSSAALIALARTRFPRHEWLEADMRALTLDRQFAGVLAWSSLFHLRADEQAALLAKVARWLTPGGRLLFNSGPAQGTAIGEMQGEPLYHASLAPEEYRAIFAANGVSEIAYVPEDPNCGRMTVWLVRKG